MATKTKENPWEELLRRMLPAGAPLPDEDHLDYSIAVEYEGPPFPYDVPVIDPVDLDSISVRSPSITSSFDSSSISVGPPVSRMSKFSRFGDNRIRNGGLIKSRMSPVEAHRLSSDSRPQIDWKIGDYSSATEDKNSSPKESETEEDKCSCSSLGESPSGVADAAIEELRSKTEKQKGGTKICKRCGKGNSLKGKEECLVCDARYCRNCLLKAMGSMPEGRKCLSCIGRPIDESKRSKLGKSSRLLRKVCSPLEVNQIMKAEKECKANQLKPEQLVVNGKQLSEDELAVLLGCPRPPQKLSPGKYWYDKDSGLWGKEREKPDRIISAKLNVGGKLKVDASNGNTKVYINGREITRIELRALKLANVQCPRDTHFWLYEDGSYEEEGQNNIKGNIWGKASARFVCSLFSLPVPTVNSHGSQEDPTTFMGRSVPEYMQQGRVQKLILFGLEGSGTSTIYKQVRFLYGKFSAEELQNIKFIIQSNMYKYLSILLEGRERFEEEALWEQNKVESDAEESAPGHNGNNGCIYSINQRFKHFSDWLLDIMATGDLDAFFPAATREYAPLLNELWKDPAIQATYKRREQLDLPDVAKYFLDQALEISSNDYEPSETDILYAEGVTQTNGIAFIEFSFGERSPISEIYDSSSGYLPSSTKYQLIRVSSKVLREGDKRLQMFEDVEVMIFCVALSDYDQMLSRGAGPVHNKMLENREVFQNLVKHPCFKDTQFVLFLNKYDALEDKINQVPLSTCEWFKDFRPLKPHHSNRTLAQQVFYYVAMKFKQLYFSLSGRKLFVWRTRALESASVDQALQYVREVLRWEEEKDANMYGIVGDDSFFSTEIIFSPYIRQE